LQPRAQRVAASRWGCSPPCTARLQLVSVAHLLECGALGAVAAHDEVHVREAAAHLGDEMHEQVHALAPHEPHHHDDVDRALRPHVVRVGRELRGVSPVGCGGAKGMY